MGGSGSLNSLVTAAAAELMAATAANSAEISQRVLANLVDALGQDFGFLRHNDHTIRATVLIAEFPPRNADPDPIAVVYFADADSVFATAEHLKEPAVVRPRPENADYQQTIEEGTGFGSVSLAAVPLLSGEVTTGVLAFGKFGDREWVTDELDALQAIATLFAQLQARIAADTQVRWLAEHDEMTGLLNRRALIAQLGERLAQGMPGPVSIVFLEVERLRAINDVFGQDAGNRFLVTFSNVLRDGADFPAAIARFGGDEFVVAPHAPMDARDIFAWAQELHRHLRTQADIRSDLFGRAASIGVATGVPGKDSASMLLSRADLATQSAKNARGVTVVAYTPQMAAKNAIRDEIERRLEEPDAANDLVLHYLPEIDLRTGEVLGTEALMRWQHSALGLLMPDSFIDVAESMPLAEKLGRLVIRAACAEFAQWQAEGLVRNAVLRVNVSPVQLIAEGVVERIAATLSEFGIEAGALCLEITERVVVADIEATRKTLTDLKDIGVQVAVDDFGTGYSAFDYLTSLPIDALKIDRRFIRDLGRDSKNLAVVRSILGLAEAFGLDVVAEGVETPGDAQALLALGCKRAQGFLFSKPLPGAQMGLLFARRFVSTDFLND
ncbi:Predicted signal transduction protein containing a membrane domain, an EAL and a GGDEF domain [Mycobacterium numidiamassiliense]|uniref:Predicted signal transduction protein containing a membrane domain, an EAL and a GGDEF domain n=1 Tax=Mycobacterium numidiamassiliense TaxID=1841861 RepID=A0A2U3PFK7_9MYCO|nr:EAL domain-containing protein [Mycobacterium numidiamassiliense]SPM42475.1 Predicted signal transduction protein containing a membrane domain, an EAL and a GGDEF domain [Mycobacterium numidiamassiliense]